ncbi:unnamed protein product [Prunus armeniaca]|uniref:Ribosome biogenesis protein NOP53 n=1 Tax=Prunus armeniaca TaxID=36596 RepID=A0A6J5WM56_PRUAR|nr:unnamed protein product [Prunus armeniaca]
MGKKAKTSRKGKKAWRANISTEDIHDFFEQSTKDALSGGSLSSAPAESLFFVDKSKDLSVKRKIEKHRQKVLHVESMLQKNPFVQAVPSSTLKKSKKTFKEVPKPKDATECGPQGSVSTSGMADLWGDKGGDNSKTKKTAKPSLIAAVEVEPPGSSFNPTFESHQETLAHAVAQEMHKVYKKELGPQPVPLTVPGEAVDEEEMYFLDADEGTDDDMNPENLDENEDAASEKRPLKTKRVTTVMLNKRARRKEQLKKEAEAKKAQKLSKEIDGLPDILQEIAKEDDEKHKRHIRRVVAKKRETKVMPPTLGEAQIRACPSSSPLDRRNNWIPSETEGLLYPCQGSVQEPRKKRINPAKIKQKSFFLIWFNEMVTRCVEPKSLAGVQRGSATDAASDFVNVNSKFTPVPVVINF